MATLAFPNVVPSSVSYGIKYTTQINISGLSGSVQTVEIPGARWVSSMTFNDLEEGESRLLISFLTQLRGSAGRFYLKDYSYAGYRGTGAGSPVVNESNKLGSTIATTGWATSGTVLKVGDYVQFSPNFEVKVINADVVPDGSGNAIISFDPPLRNSPTIGGAIVITDCTPVMFLSNDEARWSTDNAGLLTKLSIECSEAFT